MGIDIRILGYYDIRRERFRNMKQIFSSLLIFFLLTLAAFVFPELHYAFNPPCAGLDTTHSQCLKASDPAPTPGGGHSWTPIASGACGDNRNPNLAHQCYARDDSCPIKYFGSCSNPNSQLACQGFTQGSDSAGCDQSGGNTICYIPSGKVNPAPTPAYCNTNAPTSSVKNPCPGSVCDTAFGKIDVTNGSGFVKTLFQILLSLSGGIALLIIIFAGFSMALSQGNPEKIKGAQETLTSAIVGLLFIILSVAILQIIGVDILGIFKK